MRRGGAARERNAVHEPVKPGPTRGIAAVMVVVALAALLRFFALDRLPSPAGDEGTWALLARKLAHGERAGLPPDAAFVSTLFAWLMAGSMRLLGPTFAAGRAVCAVASLGAAVAAYAGLARLGARRAGLAAAAVLAVHPWAVAWGRTAAVPYALALFATTAGPLAFFVGLRERRDAWVAAGVLLVGLGAQFSPLALAAALGCAALVPRHRWVLSRPATWLAAGVVLLATAPLVLAARRAAAASPSLGPGVPLGRGIASFAHTVLTGLAGEATLRHFTGAAVAPRAALLVAVPAVVLVALAVRSRRTGVLGGFGLVQLAVATVVVPLLLAPARSWQLDAVDADRYLFAWLPGLAFCAADAVSGRGRRQGAWAVVALLAVLFAADVRGARWLECAGGPDQGPLSLEGGGAYRGWRLSATKGAVASQLADAIERDSRGAPCTVVITDWAFHPLRFALYGTSARVRDARSGPIPPGFVAPYYVVLYSDAVFASPTSPRFAASDNAALRARLPGDARRVLSLSQPDGRGLVELWRAEELAR